MQIHQTLDAVTARALSWSRSQIKSWTKLRASRVDPTRRSPLTTEGWPGSLTQPIFRSSIKNQKCDSPPAAAATAEGSRKVHGSLRKATEGYRSLRKVGLVPTLGPAHPFQAFSRVSKGYQAIIFIVPASNQNSKTKNQTFYDDFRL